MSWVVDSSVAIKWFVTEPDRVIARSLLAGPGMLVAPDFLLVEIGNTIWKLTRRGQWQGGPVRDVLAMLRREMNLIPLGELADEACDLSQQLDHPAYDCLYVSAARLRGLPLVTADRRLFAMLSRAPRVARAVWLGNFSPHQA